MPWKCCPVLSGPAEQIGQSQIETMLRDDVICTSVT